MSPTHFHVTSRESIIFGTLIIFLTLLLSNVTIRSAVASNEGTADGINRIFSNAHIPWPPAIGKHTPLPVASPFRAHSDGTSNTAAEANLYGVGKNSEWTSATTNTNNNTSTTTKCISNSPNGAKPHITKRGNVIIGSDCDITIKGDNQGDIIFTGNGNDVVYGGPGNDIIYAGSGTDQIYGMEGNDILVAGSGTDLLDGGVGNDVLLGGTGNDLLLGGLGNDKLFAGTGTTVMSGGAGPDHFDCGTSPTIKAVVMDYNPTEGDTISGNCKLVNNVPH